MRIIGGFAKGRRLKAPRGLDTRPMTGRMREALFSSLAGRLPGAEVLDLYAGTGSLGLEALSRGASSAVFVERNPAALRVLRENIEAVGLGGGVVAMDVVRFLARRVAGPEGAEPSYYDLVFVDPPYQDSAGSVTETMGMVERLTRIHGTVILHRRAGEEPPQPPGLEMERASTYGTSLIWRFRRFDIR